MTSLTFHLCTSKKNLFLDILPRIQARHSNSFHIRSNMTGVCTEWHKISSKYIRGCSEHSKYFMKNIKIFIDSLCAWFLCLLLLLFFRHNSVRKKFHFIFPKFIPNKMYRVSVCGGCIKNIKISFFLVLPCSNNLLLTVWLKPCVCEKLNDYRHHKWNIFTDKNSSDAIIHHLILCSATAVACCHCCFSRCFCMSGGGLTWTFFCIFF